MGSLAYSTYVCPAKPVVSTELAPGETQEMWSPTSSTLIYGDRDAVLVDTALTMDEGRALADWVASTGKNLIAIYVTHGHGDHFFGAPAVLDRYPLARLLATKGVVQKMREQVGSKSLGGFWRPRFPNQIADPPVVAEALTDNIIELEGEQLVAVDLGHTDTKDTTALHVPAIGLVAAGDAVYNDAHLYLVESAGDGCRSWLAALDIIEALRPVAVVAGHKRGGAKDSPESIEQTRQYLQDFDRLAQRAADASELYDTMIERHPDRINRAVLWHSAQAVKAAPSPA